jgi:AraC-like DNA-binding protein
VRAVSSKVVFSSEHLPAHLSEKARFRLWRDIYEAEIGSVDFATASAVPFRADIESTNIGPLIIASMSGSINRVTRTRAGVRADGNDHYSFVINKCRGPIAGSYMTKPLEIGAGGAFLHDASEAQEMMGGNDNAWANVIIPRAVLQGAFGRIEQRQGLAIAPSSEPLRHLLRYLELIAGMDAPLSSAMSGHISQTIIDLVGLATGAKGDSAELAGLRGLRAARLDSVLAMIGTHHADPALSAQHVAERLGLSLRYVHDLLQESGQSFSERVLELRLQHARQLLADPAQRAMRIGDIALKVGFSDISYFNHSFRRRFGGTPRSAR